MLPGYAGVIKVDSMYAVLKTEKEDTNKVCTLVSLGFQLLYKGNYAVGDSLSQCAFQLAQKLNYKTGIARSLRNIGLIDARRGNVAKAFESYNEALKLYKEMNDLLGQAAVLNSMGNVYDQAGDYPKALECYFKVRDTYSNANNKLGVAISSNNIGLIYLRQGDYPKALDNFLTALKGFQELGQKNYAMEIKLNIGIIYDDQGDNEKALAIEKEVLQMARDISDKRIEANVLDNMGDVYRKEKDYKQALACIEEGLKLHEENGEKMEVVASLNDFGLAETNLGRYDTAMKAWRKALALGEEIDYKEGTATAYNNLALADTLVKNYTEALDYATRGLEIAKKIGNLELVKDAESALSGIYRLKGDDAKALIHYKAFIATRDSLFSNQSTKKMVMEEMNYDFDKKQAEEKAAQDKKDALQQEETRKQRVTIYFVSGILLLVLGFAAFAYRSNLQRKKTNKELSIKNQKIELAYNIIEEKNHEITDSINYAKRIQHAILPTIEDIKKALPQSFVLYKPKDIVSGDFYFFHKPAKTELSLIAAADCTGHGVPGAFMSMIGSEKLNEAVIQSNDTGVILKLLNNGIRNSLHQNEEQGTSRDGMDIVLCALQGNTLNYSGANRPLWIIRKGATEIEEYKPTKKAIGGFTEEGQLFDSTEIKLKTGDTVYLFSDGYADQFGGEQGKKLTTRKFKELLLSLSDKDMDTQHHELDAFIENWKSNREQLDDILVIGIRA